jgi:hypothetical protein
MSPRLVRQPKGSSLCGQACVAMAAGVCLGAAIRAVGHRRSTSTREVISALRRLGVGCADRCRRISRARPTYPPRALVVVRRDRRRCFHWVYYKDGVFLDPEGEWPRYDGWRVTSYLEVFS